MFDYIVQLLVWAVEGVGGKGIVTPCTVCMFMNKHNASMNYKNIAELHVVLWEQHLQETAGPSEHKLYQENTAER